MYRESSGACVGPGVGRYTVSEGSFLDSAGPGGGRYIASEGSSLDSAGPGGGRYIASESSSLDSAGPGGGRHRAGIRAAFWTVWSSWHNLILYVKPFG